MDENIWPVTITHVTFDRKLHWIVLVTLLSQASASYKESA